MKNFFHFSCVPLAQGDNVGKDITTSKSSLKMHAINIIQVTDIKIYSYRLALLNKGVYALGITLEVA